MAIVRGGQGRLVEFEDARAGVAVHVGPSFSDFMGQAGGVAEWEGTCVHVLLGRGQHVPMS